MANYTIELYKLLESYGFELFDFEYSFYCDDEKAKKDFEQKFKDYYMFREIGQETVSRFKHELKTLLNIRMPYYKQLYETELACKDINFMLNKDLKEEFLIEVQNESSGISTTDGTSSSQSTGENENKFFDSPQQRVNNLDEYFTNVTKDITDSNVNSSVSNTNETTSTGKSTQKQTNLSQGNIGITSSAELLQKWRDVLINIDQMIIAECDSLFMQVF